MDSCDNDAVVVNFYTRIDQNRTLLEHMISRLGSVMHNLFCLNGRFAGGELNHCYNCIDRHVETGRKDQVAIIHDSPVTNSTSKSTYGELLTKVWF